MIAVAHARRAAPAAAPKRAEPREIGLLVASVVARAQRRLGWLATLETDVVPGDTPEAELRWQRESEAGRTLTAEVDQADGALAAVDGRFARLCGQFALSPEERDLLLGGLAPRLDPTVLTLYHQAQHRPWPTEPLIARLFGYGRRSIWRPDGPLAVWGLLLPGESAPAEPPPLLTDPTLPFWLQGEPPLDAALVGHVRRLTPPPALDDWPVAAVVARLRARRAAGQAVRLIVEGPPGSGRASFAATTAHALGLQALVVDSLPGETTWPQAWMLLQRQAAVAEAMPIWHRPPPSWPQNAPPAAFQAVCMEPGDSLPEKSRAVDAHVVLPAPDSDARLELVRRFLPGSAAWPVADRQRLAERPRPTIGDLVRLSHDQVEGAAEAERQLRLASARRLGDLAERLETGFDWDDLVLPASLHESLRDFAFEARARIAFWERVEIRRLFPGGRGLVALSPANPPRNAICCSSVNFSRPNLVRLNGNVRI